MSEFLQQIVEHKRLEIEEQKSRWPMESLAEKASLHERFSFKKALLAPERVRIIAELKKASPSRGILIDQFDPEELAARYRSGGALALSVLTESRFFQGKLEYLQIAKQSARLPILCKDFIIDPYQIHLAAAKGADAILLIVRLLSLQQLEEFLAIAQECELDCLVEIHTEQELESALNTRAQIIGVNARDLADFSVSIDRTAVLAKLIPDDKLRVAESGISTKEDISRLVDAGYSNFLVGEALVKSGDPAGLLRELRQA